MPPRGCANAVEFLTILHELSQGSPLPSVRRDIGRQRWTTESF